MKSFGNNLLLVIVHCLSDLSNDNICPRMHHTAHQNRKHLYTSSLSMQRGIGGHPVTQRMETWRGAAGFAARHAEGQRGATSCSAAPNRSSLCHTKTCFKLLRVSFSMRQNVPVPQARVRPTARRTEALSGVERLAQHSTAPMPAQHNASGQSTANHGELAPAPTPAQRANNSKRNYPAAFTQSSLPDLHQQAPQGPKPLMRKPGPLTRKPSFV